MVVTALLTLSAPAPMSCVAPVLKFSNATPLDVLYT